MNELKPCPFCGGRAKLVGGDVLVNPTYGENGAYVDVDVEVTPSWVQCIDCGATSKSFDADDDDKENAIKAWNERTEGSEGRIKNAGFPPSYSKCGMYSDDAVRGAVICPWCGDRMDKQEIDNDWRAATGAMLKENNDD